MAQVESPYSSPALLRVAHRHLARSSVPGLIWYPAVRRDHGESWAGASTSTSPGRSPPASPLIALAAGRFWLAHAFDRVYPAAPRAWFLRVLRLALAMAALWSDFVSRHVIEFGSTGLALYAVVLTAVHRRRRRLLAQREPRPDPPVRRDRAGTPRDGRAC